MHACVRAFAHGRPAKSSTGKNSRSRTHAPRKFFRLRNVQEHHTAMYTSSAYTATLSLPILTQHYCLSTRAPLHGTNVSSLRPKLRGIVSFALLSSHLSVSLSLSSLSISLYLTHSFSLVLSLSLTFPRRMSGHKRKPCSFKWGAFKKIA